MNAILHCLGFVLLDDAREALRAAVAEGEQVTCPCCDQNAKQYARKITRSAATALSLLHRDGGWVHSQVLEASGSRDHPKLRYFGLVDTDASLWCITEDGWNFIEGSIDMPRYAYIYNNEVTHYSEERVTYRQCREEFDLEEAKTA